MSRLDESILEEAKFHHVPIRDVERAYADAVRVYRKSHHGFMPGIELHGSYMSEVIKTMEIEMGIFCRHRALDYIHAHAQPPIHHPHLTSRKFASKRPDESRRTTARGSFRQGRVV